MVGTGPALSENGAKTDKLQLWFTADNAGIVRTMPKINYGRDWACPVPGLWQFLQKEKTFVKKLS